MDTALFTTQHSDIVDGFSATFKGISHVSRKQNCRVKPCAKIWGPRDVVQIVKTCCFYTFSMDSGDSDSNGLIGLEKEDVEDLAYLVHAPTPHNHCRILKHLPYCRIPTPRWFKGFWCSKYLTITADNVFERSRWSITFYAHDQQPKAIILKVFFLRLISLE